MKISLRTLPAGPLRNAIAAAEAKLTPARRRVARTKPAPMPGEVPTPSEAARSNKSRRHTPLATSPRRAVQDYAGEEMAFTVALKPRPKQRARHSVRGGKVRTYTPEQTVAHEAAIREAAVAAMSGRAALSCPVEVQIRFVFSGDPGEWPTSQADGDLDNLEKACMDALNRVAYDDDRLVVSKAATKRCGPAESISVVVRPCCG